MAGVGAKSVGRVSIRVVPDTTSLREDLKKALTRIERTTRMTIAADVDTSPAVAAMNRLRRDFDGQKVELQAGVDTGVASARIAAAARPRLVPLHVEVSKASLARAGSAIAALSGARLAGDMVQRLASSLSNLDRSLPRMAAAALGIASLVAVLMTSVGGLFTVGAGLASIAGAAIALPGILAGAGVGAGVLVVALAGAKDQLDSLVPAFEGLRDVIRSNFWASAREPIIELVTSLLPQMEAGLGRTATALGNWAASVSAGFQAALGGGVLEGMLDQLTRSIDIASTGTAGFAGVIATLGIVGSAYLPNLAQAFADISVRLDGFLAQAAADGRLTGWIDAGVVALAQLGGVIANTGSILSGFSAAAQAAGGGGLMSLESALGNIAAVVNGPAFQSTLITLFQGAAAGASGLAAALGPLGSLIAVLAPTLSSALAGFGQLAGVIGGQLATALSAPAFVSGLGVFLGGLQAGIAALLPTLPALAGLLGSVASFAGVLAAALGPVLGSAISALAPILGTLLTALQPVIPILGGALIQIVTALAPLIAALVPPLASLIGAIAGLLGPVVGILVMFVDLLAPIITTLLPPLIGLAGALFPAIGQLVTAFLPLIGALMPLVNALLPPLIELMTALMPAIVAVIGVVATLISSAVGPLTTVIGALTPVIVGVVRGLTDILVPAIGIVTGVLNGLITFLTGVFTGNWDKAWKGVVAIFSSVFNGIGSLAKGILNGVIEVINGVIGGVNGITGSIGIAAIPKIPKLATGGDVLARPGGTVVRLGEGGQDESVVNRGLLNNYLELSTRIAERAAAGIGNGEPSEMRISGDLGGLQDIIKIEIKKDAQWRALKFGAGLAR